jgi:hypothetical protein
MGGNAFVGEVGDGFGEGTKILKRFAPAHWQDEGEGHQGFFILIRQHREGDAEDGHVGRAQLFAAV